MGGDASEPAGTLSVLYIDLGNGYIRVCVCVCETCGCAHGCKNSSSYALKTYVTYCTCFIYFLP